MNNTHARECLIKTLSFKRACNININTPISVFDAVEKAGLELRFRSEPTLEGMYFKDERVILVSVHRPIGRQAFTCAHELGHHAFGHGTRVDNSQQFISIDSKPQEEKAADLFAAHFLMPLMGIKNDLKKRNWNIKELKPHQAFVISSLYGVSYEALLNHLRYNSTMLSENTFQELSQVKPKSIKTSLLGFEYSKELTIVDRFWHGRPIDLVSGQLVIFSNKFNIENTKNLRVRARNSRYSIMEATTQSVSSATLDGESFSVRVSGNHEGPYTGRSKYRFLEEPDESTISSHDR